MKKFLVKAPTAFRIINVGNSTYKFDENAEAIMLESDAKMLPKTYQVSSKPIIEAEQPIVPVDEPIVPVVDEPIVPVDEPVEANTDEPVEANTDESVEIDEVPDITAPLEDVVKIETPEDSISSSAETRKTTRRGRNTGK